MPYADVENQRERSKRLYAERKNNPAFMEAKRAEERARYARKMNDPEYREKKRAASREQKRKDPETTRARQCDSNIKRFYGVDRKRYDELLAEQGGVCAICFGTNGNHRLAVDHYHVTGTVRGLLCHNCNQAIGKFKDSPEIVKRALAYLRRHGGS